MKLLIANRGEIAVRVMRTAREMNIPTVAIYTPPDRKALHVRYADEAYEIDSYLNIDGVTQLAKKAGADFVHPGYGFLSENAKFAQALIDAGIMLLGPKPSSMEAMGSKTNARQVMQAAGVPVVPEGAEEYPVMIKAAAGGGGRGMRKVERAEDFQAALESAKREAMSSFGDDTVYVEKFLEKPRHIEVQIFADTHGNVVSFPERECSVQRRHQKVIEESPSCFVDPAMREKMGEVARQAAKAVDYVGAGTIEFLVDAHKNFYFMEMNTRLQVEHPVTEMITGLDLVEWQIRVARGEQLPLSQEQIKPNGWAVEARVCAEDPEQNFMPTPGLVKEFRQPGGPYVRTDAAVYSGYEIPTLYDSMIAKVIAWAPTRETAFRRLDRALEELVIKGCTTNTQFLRQLLAYEPIIDGEYDTSVIEKFLKNPPEWVSEEHRNIAALAAELFKVNCHPSGSWGPGLDSSLRWNDRKTPWQLALARQR